MVEAPVTAVLSNTNKGPKATAAASQAVPVMATKAVPVMAIKAVPVMAIKAVPAMATEGRKFSPGIRVAQSIPLAPATRDARGISGPTAVPAIPATTTAIVLSNPVPQ